MGSKAERYAFADSEDSKPHTVIYRSCNGATKVGIQIKYCLFVKLLIYHVLQRD